MEENIICLICNRRLFAVDSVVAIDCGHVFHEKCLESSQSCAECDRTYSVQANRRLHFSGQPNPAFLEKRAIQKRIVLVDRQLDSLKRSFKDSQTEKKTLKKVVSIKRKMQRHQPEELESLANSAQLFEEHLVRQSPKITLLEEVKRRLREIKVKLNRIWKACQKRQLMTKVPLNHEAIDADLIEIEQEIHDFTVQDQVCDVLPEKSPEINNHHEVVNACKPKTKRNVISTRKRKVLPKLKLDVDYRSRFVQSIKTRSEPIRRSLREIKPPAIPKFGFFGKFYKCQHCAFSTFRRSYLDRHKRRIHRKLTCDMCGAKFQRQFARFHMKGHLLQQN